ncbi:MAG: HTH-type transcriptional activator CmpR [Syntrophaceae bacterium PtaU1.Bin231]|nr:MAG: HTH-type transcriptional activator CmpR [Syntrophaceae bacterium PtaU1.Bin231]HOG16250.1 selenium metabolism-associated LysR family transcriptional regulator [Syntrophales bacterium]
MAGPNFRNITLLQMESFIALVEEESFTRAARRMFVTQPTLTKHIHSLEEAAGARIVDRAAAGVAPTPEGRILYDYARRILRLREVAREKIQELGGNGSGTVHVAASTIPATYLLPRVLGGFLKRYPAVRLHIQAADSRDVSRMVSDGEAEMGFVGKQPADRKLLFEPLWEDRLVAVFPAGHPWSKRGSVRPEELFGEPFVMREEGSGTRETFADCLLKSSGRNIDALHVVCEMGSSEAVKEAVLNGMGISLLSVFAVEREAAAGKLGIAAVEGCPMKRHFYLLYRRNFTLTACHERFREAVRESRLSPCLPGGKRL